MRYAFWRRRKADDPNNPPRPKKKKSWIREWLDAALFAIIAATIIRTFFVEAYTIPSESMEGTMLVNDYLFVSKLSYGPRMPMTPLAVPLVHNTMPITGGKSYSDAVQWKYRRLPGFGHVERNDVVVFNFPNNDTTVLEAPDRDYYQFVREAGWQAVNANMTVITRPVDKKENYIKRCVAIAGDTLELRNKTLYINGRPGQTFPHAKVRCVLEIPQALDEDFIDQNGIEVEQYSSNGPNGYIYALNLQYGQMPLVQKLPGAVLKLRNVPPATQSMNPDHGGPTYPYDVANYNWNRDNYGPIVIPKKGATIQLTPQNISLYRRVIKNYEHNELAEQKGQILINGQAATSYTFKMDYYWMMGDNRDNSADSRYFGFVPEDHVVGKAWFVWLSYGQDGIRWRRIFRSVKTLEK